MWLYHACAFEWSLVSVLTSLALLDTAQRIGNLAQNTRRMHNVHRSLSSRRSVRLLDEFTQIAVSSSVLGIAGIAYVAGISASAASRGTHAAPLTCITRRDHLVTPP